MFTLHHSSLLMVKESEVTRAGLDADSNGDSAISAIANKLYSIDKEDRSILLAIADRAGIKPLYAFGRLRLRVLVDELTRAWLPTIIRLSSLDEMYFAFVYEDGYEDVLEHPFVGFECPHDAILVGCYSTEDAAYDALANYEG